MSIKRIMMPIDVGDQPVGIASLVASLARRLDAEVLVFHAMTRDLEKYGEPYLFAKRSQLKGHARDVAETAFARIRADDQFRGLRTTTRVDKARHAATAVVECATRENVDLIVVPNLMRPKERMRKVLLGSVTERILRESLTPVLIYPISSIPPDDESEITFKLISAPTDLSRASHAAFSLVADIARAYGAQVELLHVVEQKVPLSFQYYHVHSSHDLNPAFRDEVIEYLEAVITERLPGIDCHIHLRIGKPSTVIPQFVEHNKSDLLVMGTQGHDSIGDVILGSTTERVIHTACAPIVIDPRGQRVEQPPRSGSETLTAIR